jgi:hypothetical protein
MNFETSLSRYACLATEVAFIFDHDEGASRGISVILLSATISLNILGSISAENYAADM